MTRPVEGLWSGALGRFHDLDPRGPNEVINGRLREAVQDSLARPRSGGVVNLETAADPEPGQEFTNDAMNEAIRAAARQLNGIPSDE